MEKEANRLFALVFAVAHSPIVLRSPALPLPAGFGDVDLEILNWIATEAGELRRRCRLM
jgi:hypothetical protein